MAASRKRKHAVTEETVTDKQVLNRKKQKGIESFGTIKKGPAADNELKKSKTHHQELSCSISLHHASCKIENRKRRLELDITDSKDNTIHHGHLTDQSIFEQYAAQNDGPMQYNKRFKHALPSSPIETPAKCTAALFNKLKLDSTIPFTLHIQSKSHDSPLWTPEVQAQAQNLTLPNELLSFCQLHAAFLTALTLYYAHNGTSSPVNIQTLLPQITQVWKKRDVTVEDLRKLLAIAPSDRGEFAIEDYGRAGIFLSRIRPGGESLKRAGSYIDELELNALFKDKLKQKWTSWLAEVDNENRTPSRFMTQIPMVDILRNENADKSAPLFARGQQRLAQLKADQTAAHIQAVKPTVEVVPSQKTVQGIQNRSTHLLDRVLARQAISASLPSGPTKLQLERKAALHRVEDVARVLDVLVGSKLRCTLSMPAMVQQIQQSLRNPISREEIERCLDLMAQEITPGFVKVLVSGTVQGVVVNSAQKLGLEDLRERVRRAVV
ncbi:hypothetical protein M433DRAFT_158161 [Acidomyces richmondensis BFW]|nr:MAG: hypothetical protein FE78DRAFT_94457 [Acidomyces sp. 'richmondensis']KYG42212.1 hypothetical protein M433DRAFT_158161 [Acidomyces richmondensis BFW]